MQQGPSVIKPEASYLLALMIASTAVAIWGGTPIATKIAVRTLDPAVVTLWRTFLAAALALPIILFLRPGTPRTWRTGGALGLAAISGYIAFPWFFALGLEKTSASHASLMVLLAPVMTGLFASALGLLKITAVWLGGVALALSGSLLLVVAPETGSGSSIGGDVLVFIAICCAAIGYLSGAAAARSIGAPAVTLWGHLLAAALLSPALPWLISNSLEAAYRSESLFATAYLAVFSSLVAYIAWYKALSVETGLSQIQFLQGLFGLAASLLLLNETAGAKELAAVLLCVCGVVLTQKAQRKKATLKPQPAEN